MKTSLFGLLDTLFTVVLPAVAFGLIVSTVVLLMVVSYIH